MINLEKFNRKSASLPPLRRSVPVPYFHPLFEFFHIPPSWGGNQNLLPSPLKKTGDPNYE